ncbi:MAG: serine/threonine protein kinase [Deltaproteobacteria bacterium]|nr:serine/threonine protein kinase [Deltaproteobacteria bacterium]
MDKYSAEKLSTELLGKTIGGWLIEKYINHGKSAVVFLASKDAQRAAFKVFDPEIVDRYGRDAQRKRIERERSLIGKSHPNLVSVYDGGEQRDFLFVVMEYFDGKNLAEVLLDIPPSEFRSLISQIASAAKFLEEASLAHRDIKPENIGISSDMKSAKLLDFGVLRPFDLSNITNEGDQLYFIGTLQYSPPELLFREEEQSIEAWRAITFYQLGAVLHDLLMQKPLFEEFRNPYARLVRAVEKEIPLIDNPEADADLRLLAQNCLAKTPGHRLDTVKWEDFCQPKVADPMEAARRRIAQHRVAALQSSEAPISPGDLLGTQIFTLKTLIFSAVVSTIKTESFPRYSMTEMNKELHQYLLRVLFEPSEKSGLGCYFAVYCQGVVVDPTANFHELRTWACVSSTREAVPAEPESSAPSRTVKGALIEQDIRLHIQGCLLLAYAGALDTAVKGTGAVQWLKLGRDE